MQRLIFTKGERLSKKLEDALGGRGRNSVADGPSSGWPASPDPPTMGRLSVRTTNSSPPRRPTVSVSRSAE